MKPAPPSHEMLLVGSRALTAEGFTPARSCGDWDLWITEQHLEEILPEATSLLVDDFGDTCAVVETAQRRYAARVIPAGDARELFMEAARARPRLQNDEGWSIRIASPTSIRLIKRAFAYLPTKWHRNVEDYHRLVAQTENQRGIPAEEDAYHALREEVIAKLRLQSGKLAMHRKNEDFFADFKYPWLRVYEHDQLHQATCYGDRPLYLDLKDDPAKAYISQTAFERLSHDEKIRLVREEAYALALERVLIPAMDLGIAHSAELAFLHALRRISTTLAQGWFRDFAIDHYDEIKNYDKNYLCDYHQHCENGKLVKKLPLICPKERKNLLSDYWNRLRKKDMLAGLP